MGELHQYLPSQAHPPQLECKPAEVLVDSGFELGAPSPTASLAKRLARMLHFRRRPHIQ